VTAPLDQAIDLAFRFLVVTSRAEPPQNIPIVRASVEPLSPQKLSEFVAAYVSETTKRPMIEASLRQFAGKSISPLFARLAIARLLKDETLPQNVRDLVKEYVLSLRPPIESTLRAEDFLLSSVAEALNLSKIEMNKVIYVARARRNYLPGTAKAELQNQQHGRISDKIICILSGYWHERLAVIVVGKASLVEALRPSLTMQGASESSSCNECAIDSTVESTK
jgi:hypothetical protein